MQFTREIHRLLLGLLFGFILILLSATYYAVIGPETILQRDDNARLFEAEASILRGRIYDRNGNLLVTSVQDENGFVSRRTFYPETYSALGYYSLRYGVSGAESAYDTLLRGDNLPYDLGTYFVQDILHRPRQGSDIRLTLDLNVQRDLVRLMQDHQGAGVILSVPDGEILALVSLPTINPNTLDTNWAQLRASPGNPFFNRVLQGKYQPGSLMLNLLIAAAISNQVPLTTSFTNATRPILLGDVVLSCETPSATATLTLQEAYELGCPSPFVDLVNQLDGENIGTSFSHFQLGEPFLLPGFVSPIQVQPTVSANSAILSTPFPDEAITLEDALGQGQLTTTPLRMALIAAGIVNNGNAPEPITFLASRPPNTTEWLAAEALHPTTPITTIEIAGQLQGLMRGNMREFVANQRVVGGYSALAYSGLQTQTWFIGFMLTPSGRGVVIALLIENSDDLALVQSIGLDALESALRSVAVTLTAP